MGMFDEIVCNHPLPGTPPEFVTPGHLFQTKDLDCLMGQYAISEDGTIDYSTTFTGTVRFYTSNILGTGPGLYTSGGEDAESVDYSATFIDGKLRDIRQVSRTRKPALPISKRRFPDST